MQCRSSTGWRRSTGSSSSRRTGLAGPGPGAPTPPAGASPFSSRSVLPPVLWVKERRKEDEVHTEAIWATAFWVFLALFFVAVKLVQYKDYADRIGVLMEEEANAECDRAIARPWANCSRPCGGGSSAFHLPWRDEIPWDRDAVEVDALALHGPQGGLRLQGEGDE